VRGHLPEKALRGETRRCGKPKKLASRNFHNHKQ
jgi:hypothetical protein